MKKTKEHKPSLPTGWKIQVTLPENSYAVMKRITEFIIEKHPRLSEEKTATLINAIYAAYTSAEGRVATEKNTSDFIKQKKIAPNLIKQGELFLKMLKSWQEFYPTPCIDCTAITQHITIAKQIRDYNCQDSKDPGRSPDIKLQSMIQTLAGAYALAFEKKPTAAKDTTNGKDVSTEFHVFCEAVYLAIYQENLKLPASTLNKYIRLWEASPSSKVFTPKMNLKNRTGTK